MVCVRKPQTRRQESLLAASIILLIHPAMYRVLRWSRASVRSLIRHAHAPAVQATGALSDNSFAFSGCGWLTPFHLGVLDALIQRNMVNSETVFAGSSGGAIAALVGCSGVHPTLALQKLIDLSKNKEFWQDIDAGLRNEDFMVDFPDDIVDRCNGRLYVTATRVWPKPSAEVTMFSNYDSLNDILSCVAASCFIPFYCSQKLYVECRGGRYIDGGLLAIMPPIGNVKISPLPKVVFPRRLRPDISPKPALRIEELTKNAFIPPPAAELERLYEIGIESTSLWLSDKK